jgi:hypothetical protein
LSPNARLGGMIAWTFIPTPMFPTLVVADRHNQQATMCKTKQTRTIAGPPILHASGILIAKKP